MDSAPTPTGGSTRRIGVRGGKDTGLEVEKGKAVIFGGLEGLFAGGEDVGARSPPGRGLRSYLGISPPPSERSCITTPSGPGGEAPKGFLKPRRSSVARRASCHEWS